MGRVESGPVGPGSTTFVGATIFRTQLKFDIFFNWVENI